jgi:hypothetical protein
MHNTYKKIVLHKALGIWKQTGGGETSAKVLKSQMNLYKNCEPPFIESVDTVKNWWSSCELKKNEKHIAIWCYNSTLLLLTMLQLNKYFQF